MAESKYLERRFGPHWQEIGEVELTYRCCGRTDVHVHLEAEDRLWALTLGWLASRWRPFLAGAVAVVVLWAGSASPMPAKQGGGTVTRLEVGTDTGAQGAVPAVQGILAAQVLGETQDDTQNDKPTTPRAAGTASARSTQPLGSAGNPLLARASTPARPWQPADECSRISRPVSARAMVWCPYTAMRLYQTGDWQPGDLTKLMRTMDCESGGNPLAKNPRSSASGLFQFLRSTFARWGPIAADTYGFDNPGVFYGYDNISAAVLLFKASGPGPWPTCGRR